MKEIINGFTYDTDGESLYLGGVDNGESQKSREYLRVDLYAAYDGKQTRPYIVIKGGRGSWWRPLKRKARGLAENIIPITEAWAQEILDCLRAPDVSGQSTALVYGVELGQYFEGHGEPSPAPLY